MSLSKKLRWEVLRRDSFTCQYCGRKAPLVVLEVDHVDARSRGGGDALSNLVTACFDCNRGKKDAELYDIRRVREERVSELMDAYGMGRLEAYRELMDAQFEAGAHSYLIFISFWAEVLLEVADDYPSEYWFYQTFTRYPFSVFQKALQAVVEEAKSRGTTYDAVGAEDALDGWLWANFDQPIYERAAAFDRRKDE